ncbi:hypothetical protein Pla110_29060 [Polystyrenella longa]|uniref:GYF domain-containing protein n=1 Tax=Polystyrenella longa TaxID=2528007 RepID=A0A518CPM4_9PLAN|nr:DUF4339 domain-containing protein [Polystyrenella longa]QDU81168.1 hypothetical protein Pla110_29060 [Polystyrenella longa]
MINEWYYQQDGEEIGPVPFEQIKDLARSGQLSPEDQIRDAVSGMLLPAKSIGGLFPAPTANSNNSSVPPARRRRTSQDSLSQNSTQRPTNTRRPRERNLYEESSIGKVAQEAMAEQSRTSDRDRRQKSLESGTARYESANSKTRQTASRIGEYAEQINDNEESESRFAFLGELKEHPIKLTILAVCIAAGIFKWLPERDYGPQVYKEFNKIYADVDHALTEGATEDEWNSLKEQSRAEIEILNNKLAMKETRSPVERQLITIGKNLYVLFDAPGNQLEAKQGEVVKSLNNVREQLE